MLLLCFMVITFFSSTQSAESRIITLQTHIDEKTPTLSYLVANSNPIVMSFSYASLQNANGTVTELVYPYQYSENFFSLHCRLLLPWYLYSLFFATKKEFKIKAEGGWGNIWNEVEKVPSMYTNTLYKIRYILNTRSEQEKTQAILTDKSFKAGLMVVPYFSITKRLCAFIAQGAFLTWLFYNRKQVKTTCGLYIPKRYN